MKIQLFVVMLSVFVKLKDRDEFEIDDDKVWDDLAEELINMLF